MTATHGEGAYGNAAGVTTPTEHKMAQVTEFVKTAANTIRPGLLWDGNGTVVTGKANMSYDVRAFSIVTQRSATSGVMKWANDAVVNVTTTTSPGSNSRYDVVYAWHREFSLDGTNSDPVIGVTQGAAAASPTVPSLASFPGAVQLAAILVPAGVTATNSGATITQTAPFTATDGGSVPVRNATELAAYTNTIQGQRAYRIDIGVNFVYYAAYNASTNPAGARIAGWYPAPGERVQFYADANAGQSLSAGANTVNGTAFAAGATELSGMTSFVNGALTVTYEGLYDVLFFLGINATTGQALIWVDGVQILTNAPATGTSNPAIIGTVKCNAGSVITFRTFTGGAGNTTAPNPSTQASVRWRGVRNA